MQNQRSSSAYTLIEVLAVIVLMGLVAAALVPSLAQTSARADRARLLADVVHLDTQARQLASTGQVHLIRWESERVTLRTPSVTSSSSSVIKEIQIPDHFEIERIDNERDLVFNTLGQSPNYTVVVRSDSWAQVIAFNGRSGWYKLETLND